MNQAKASKTILIVDDDESIRTGFQETFEANGYRALIADKAESTYDLLEKHRPDVIILDYYLLSDLSGVDICKHVRSQPKLKHTKLIMITGVLTKNQAQRMLHFGFDKIIIKPIETKALIAEIRQLTG